MDHINQLIQVGEISGKSKVLDLGCDNGMITEYISDLTGAHLTGIVPKQDLEFRLTEISILSL
jgi:predicted TPR repeat methyltransferase